MSAIFEFIKNHMWKIIGFNIIFFFAGSLIFPSIISLLIQKQNFIYLVAESPLVGIYSIYGFCIFIFLCAFTMGWQIFHNM